MGWTVGGKVYYSYEEYQRARALLKESRADLKTSVLASPVFQTRSLALDPHLVFVLMPFTEDWSDYLWEKEIRPTVQSYRPTPLRCIRADDLFGHDVMVDIYESIARARVVIADITTRNANVFYELGIAHTLGKDVILLSQGAQHIPFDLLRFRHCIYSNDASGHQIMRKYLLKALGNILGASTNG